MDRENMLEAVYQYHVHQQMLSAFNPKPTHSRRRATFLDDMACAVLMSYIPRISLGSSINANEPKILLANLLCQKMYSYWNCQLFSVQCQIHRNSGNPAHCECNKQSYITNTSRPGELSVHES